MIGGVSAQSGRYEHIDALRAFAVILVVVAHAGLGNVVPGGSGVTIFFTISGFIITHLLIKEMEKTGKFRLGAFYARRLIKLAPPFVVVIAIPTFFYSFVEHIDWLKFLSQVFFIFNRVYVTEGDAGVLPGSGVVWSLSIEEQFYAVFALIWLMVVRSRRCIPLVVGASIVTAIMSLTMRIQIGLNSPSHTRVYYGTMTRIDAIAIGVLTAVLFSNISKGSWPRLKATLQKDWVLGGSAALFLLSLVYRDELFRETFRYTFQAIATAGVILNGLFAHSSPWSDVFGRLTGLRIVQVLGLASYSIYLCHLTVDMLFLSLYPNVDTWLSVPIQVLSGLAIGWVIWFLVERPIQHSKARRQFARSIP